MEKIAIIGSGVIAKAIAKRARDLNIESHCFSWNKNDVACEFVDYFHEVNIFEVDKIVKICRETGINGVIATTELTIFPTAKIADELGLNGNPIGVSEEITNKYLIRNKVKNVEGIRQPEYWKYVSGKIPEVKKYPVIIKPIAAGGKRGIHVIYSQSGMADAIKDALIYSKVKGVLIEEYLVRGREYSVESLSYKGKHYIIQMTQKDSSGPPHCNELGHHQPAELCAEMRNKVEKNVSGMLTEVGIENGPCHTEIKIIDNDIYLIEINGRPGGDHIVEPLTELSTGYPFLSAIIWIALNQFESHEPNQMEKNYCGIYFVTEETAYLKPIFDQCENYSWLYKKNKISEEPTKIIFNNEDNLNYFIYYSKDRRPDMTELLRKIIYNGSKNQMQEGMME